MQKKFEMNGPETLGEILEYVRSSLKEYKLDSKSTVKTELLSEEILVRLIEHGDFSKGKPISVSIRKLFGNLSIDFQVPGDEFEFMVSPDIDDGIDEEASSEAIRNIILRSLGDKISYRCSRHFNNVRLNVLRSQFFNLYKIMAAMFLAIIAGAVMRNLLPADLCGSINDNVLQPFCTLFMNGLKMCAVPIVFFSIVTCFSQTESLSGLKRVGFKLFATFFVIMLIGSSVGYAFVLLFKTGSNLHLTAVMSSVSPDQGSLPSFGNILTDLIPSNIVKPFADGNMVQLIILAILIGVAAGACRIKIITSAFDELGRLFMKLIGLFICLLPLFVFCSVTSLFVTTGAKALLSVMSILCTILSANLMLTVLFFIILSIFGFNPVRVLKKTMQTLITAFTTSSSLASMPEAMKAMGNMGVAPKMYQFGIPLGMTICKSTLCLYLISVVCITANIYGIDMPFMKVLSVILSSVVLVMAMPGIPGMAIVCLSSVLTMAGCPLDVLGLVVGIDLIIDMFATVGGVTGALLAVMIVAKSEKLINKDLL